ncbi:MAG: hypothetical protein AAF202_06275 [Pseudomonadota bacterium]
MRIQLRPLSRLLLTLATLLFTTMGFTSCDLPEMPGSMRALDPSLGAAQSSDLSPLNKAIVKTPSKLMTSRQYFVSFLSVTGVSQPNTRLLSRYGLVKSVLPTKTDLGLLNAPIAMGLTNLAGATCEQMYDDEIIKEPQHRFFLEGNDSEDFGMLDVDRFTERLALAAWGSAPSAQESMLFNDFYDDFELQANNNDNPQKKAKGFLVSVCTAIMTAPKSIVF